MDKQTLKNLIVGGAQWLQLFGTMTARPIFLTASAVLMELANNDTQLDAIITGANTVAAAWKKVLEWLHVEHPAAAAALDAPGAE